jgi:hypothetical protein
MAEPVWPRLEAIWTWPTAPPPHLIQRLVATTGDRGNDQRCRRRRERDPPGKQRADEPRRRRKAAGPLLSRCTKLGDWRALSFEGVSSFSTISNCALIGDCVRPYVVSFKCEATKLAIGGGLLLPGEISQFTQDYGSP